MFSDVKILVVSKIVAHAIQFVFLFVIAKYYSPDLFGVLNEAQMLATLLAILISLQLHLTIATSRTNEEANDNLVKTVRTIVLLFVIAVLVMVPFRMVGVFYTVVLGFLVAVSNAHVQYIIQKGWFRKLAIYYVIRGGGVVVTQVFFIGVESDFSLVWAAILGELVSTCLVVYLGGVEIRRYCSHMSGALFEFVVNNRHYSLTGTLQEFVSSITFSAPLLLIVGVYGYENGGLFGMASKIFWAPTILISSSIAQVFYHKLASGDARVLLDKASWVECKYIISVLGVACFVLFNFKNFVLYFLGVDWVAIVDWSPYLVANCLIYLYSSPYRVYFRFCKKLEVPLCVEALSLICIIILFCIKPSIDVVVSVSCTILIFQSVLMILFSKRVVALENEQTLV